MKNNFTKQFNLLVLLLFMAFSNRSVAQISSYVFSSSSGSYTEVVTGTVIATASATTGAGSLDDLIYDLPAGTIPFSFNFNGTAYTGCKVSTNGFITFGTTAPAASGSTTGHTPLSATTAYSGAVSAFGRNLNGYFFTGVPTQIAELRHAVLGTAPNRTFVIQWKNFKPFNYSATTFSSPLNFQIRLLEGSNAIEVIYNVSGTFGASVTAQVGLRGSSNAFPANVNNRLVVTGTNTWATSNPGVANTSSCELLNTLLPASGLKYTWALSSCPSPTTLGVTNVTQSSAGLTWVSAGGGGTFKVEYGPQGFTPGTGTVINNATSPQIITGLSAQTNYAFYVQQICAGGNSANVGPFNFSSGSPGEDCSSAPSINVASSLANCSFTVVNSGVSQNGPNGNCSDVTGNVANDDRWYKFVAPANGKKLIITTTAGTVNDWVMQLWSSCALAPTDLVKCSDDDTAGTFMPRISLCQNEYVAGQTYYIRLWTYSQTLTGSMNLCVYEDVACPLAPVNDECISAIRLTVNNSTGCPSGAVTFTDLNATPSGDAATCDAASKNDVWFVFNTGTFGDLNITLTKLTATNIRAQILFECGGFEVACWNPADGPHTVTGLNPVADYILRVWSPAGTAGTFSICVNDVCASPTAVISGNTTMCPGNTANLLVNFTGTAPYSFVYSNGTSNQTINTSNNPYILQVTPSANTTYTLVSMSDATCAGTVSGSATVNLVAAPTVTLAPFSPICSNAGFQTLTGGSPAGGVYSGNGVNGSSFNPAVGTSTITYTVTYGIGCQKSASQVWTVTNAPVVTLNGFGNVCNNIAPFTLTGGTPAGGTYSGTGVSAGMFNPATAGLGTKIITYAVNSGGCIGSDTATITVISCTGCVSPPTANAGPDKSVCAGSGVALSGSIGGSAIVGTWSGGTGSFTPNATTLTATYTPSASEIIAGSVKLILTTNDPDGAGACVAAKDSMIVTVNSIPAPSAIVGAAGFCRPSTGNPYSVDPIAGATFTWTGPANSTIATGQGTNSITVNFAANASAGNLSVTASNSCGTSTPVTKALAIRSSIPGLPGVITGSNNGCPGESKLYTIRKIANADLYIWTPPIGATINGLSTPFTTADTMVTVVYTASFTTGDTLRVKSSNCFGVSANRNLRINRNAPGTPGTISGQNAGLCNLSGITYAIPAAVTNATSYTWRTTIVGATINGSTSPVTVTSLSVVANFGTFTSGQLFVKANNGCGSSAERSLTVNGRPAAPTAITGPVAVCDGQTGVAYSTSSIPFASSYNWGASSGSSIASGQNTTAVTANFSATPGAGFVRVRSTNACGSSSFFTLNVTINNCPRLSDDNMQTEELYIEAYPNPATDVLNVPVYASATSNVKLEVTNLVGQKIKSVLLGNVQGWQTVEIEVSDFGEGMYFVSVYSGEKVATKKFTVY